MQMTI